MKKAFTMIELIFVIVVIGILAGIAIPKFAATRDDANIVKGKSTVASIQSGLVTERTRRIMRGQTRYPESLDSNATATSNDGATMLFTQVLENGGIRAKHSAGGWQKTALRQYDFYIQNGRTVRFTYDNVNGTFTCNQAVADCSSFFVD
jgi:general secretion pathway protein G